MPHRTVINVVSGRGEFPRANAPDESERRDDGTMGRHEGGGERSGIDHGLPPTLNVLHADLGGRGGRGDPLPFPKDDRTATSDDRGFSPPLSSFSGPIPDNE